MSGLPAGHHSSARKVPMKRKLCLGALVVAVLSGCATLQSTEQSATSSRPRTASSSTFDPLRLDPEFFPEPFKSGACGASCFLTVDVQGCVPSVSVPRTHLNDPNGTIVWHITRNGYSWPQTGGIVITRTPNPFDGGQKLSDRVWQVKARGKAGDGKGEYYPYKVFVIENATGRKCVLDPGLVTDW